MKKILCSLAALVLVSCSAKWEPLFNGENLEGWYSVGSAKFEAVNGEIVGTAVASESNSYLISDKNYSDFILEFEFYNEGINSGVQFRSYQVNDTVRGMQFEIDPFDITTGAVYDEATGRDWLCFPNDDANNAFVKNGWNKARIEAIGYMIRTWINGVQCANILDDERSEGFIALQVHAADSANMGKQVKWRNLKICTSNVAYFASTDITLPTTNLIANTLTEEEIADGWELLWNGKDLEGWRSAYKDSLPEKGWAVVDDDLLDCPEGVRGGDLITSKTYKNFVLKVDYKFPQGANSGIKYFIQTKEESDIGETIGCEFQILDDIYHHDAQLGMSGNRKMGSLYDLIPAKKGPWENRTILNGWRTATIVVNGPHVEHYLNGVKVVEYNRQSQQWNALVAYSKFKKHTGKFGNFERGHILLQDHSNTVYFRNIKIKELQ